MSDARFVPPGIGAPVAVSFPRVARETLPNGLALWIIPHAALPLVTATLVLPCGSADDPPSQPGLVGLTADLLDRGADGLDAIGLAEALARIGADLDIDVSADGFTATLTTLTRHLGTALALLAGVIIRPHLGDDDFTRLQQQRINRLRQLSSSASAAADRVFLASVFGTHPYGHGVFGTTRALEAMTPADVRDVHARRIRPEGGTLVIAGAVEGSQAADAVARHFGDWSSAPAGEGTAPLPAPVMPGSRTRLVDRPGAPQSELRIGHLGPPRHVDDYHAMVTLNAILGGQFSSRINQNLREAKGYTYGARTSFDFRRASGTFVCDTSVQPDATAAAVHEVQLELSAIQATRPVDADELERAKRALTRGYVRHFETSGQVARAAAALASMGLPDDTYDRFVPEIEALTPDDIARAARARLCPDDLVVVVVGDASRRRSELEALMAVELAAAEF